jgi:hypothetical protein
VINLVAYFRSRPREFRFLEQYFNSPYGNDKIQAKILMEDGTPNDLFNRLFLNGQQEGTVRKLPLPVYPVMVFGPVSCLVRYALFGDDMVNDTVIRATAEACWNAIKA